ncbi:DMT family transporter [Streptomyces sp. NPDC085481]|uniref:DMT family transporter n=1 Tax=Streptomyces sp. NPDC085481 TaxID=3365727 RepID=UPI0037CEB749
MSPLVLSVLLALVSAVAYAAAAIVQERVAASTTGPRYAPLRSPAWWGSVLLNGLGATLHVAALAYGPLSLVQPLGALTIVFALPMAALFVGRRAGRTAWRGAVMATVGLAGLLSLTGGTGAQALADGERHLLAAATFGAVAGLFVVAHVVGRSVLRSVILAAAAGVSFGIASVFTKSVAEEWTASAPLAEWTSLLILSALAVTGLLLSQASYRGAGLAAPLATVTVVNPVIAAAVGLTLFGESFRYGAAGTVAALICGAVAAGGLVQLTMDRLARPEDSLSVSDPAPDRAPDRDRESPDRDRESRDRESPDRASDRDAPGAEVGEGVDVGAVPGTRAHLEVQVRSRTVAGRS